VGEEPQKRNFGVAHADDMRPAIPELPFNLPTKVVNDKEPFASMTLDCLRAARSGSEREIMREEKLGGGWKEPLSMVFSRAY
jgi:hypothetical protein